MEIEDKQKIIHSLEGQRSDKFILMILLMEDLRGDWSGDYESRANKVKELADELGYTKTSQLVDSYFRGIEKYGDDDGRHFRCDFKESGGYENVEIPKEFSKELIKDIEEFCRNPDCRFDDYNIPYDEEE